jgi:hypothetical protein
MLYFDRMTTYNEFYHNFKAYRLIRLLHDLRVIEDDELIRHEEYLYAKAPAGCNIDWFHYRVQASPDEWVQF